MKAAENTFLISTFIIGDTVWGIDTLDTQEIILIPDITTVHHSPDYIIGIINLRGRIVTVVDLGKKMDVPSAGLTDSSRIIIVAWGSEQVGLQVDSVSDVI